MWAPTSGAHPEDMQTTSDVLRVRVADHQASLRAPQGGPRRSSQARAPRRRTTRRFGARALRTLTTHLLAH
jgi:hypothetical protein